MSKKAAKAKELTSEEKIEEALKSNTKINELKIQRDLGEITPEVLEMCNKHVDLMLETAKKRSVHPVEELELAASQIKNDQEMLIAVTQFMDAYEEVLVWNKLIRQKKLDKNVTSRHSEMDIALYHGKVCKMQLEKKYSAKIHALIYEHGHRNDKR